MERLLHEDKTFDKIDYTVQELASGEFNNCVFKNCNFADSQLSHALFSECVFDNCNLGNARVNGTKLQEVTFRNSKLLGLNFYQCADFLFSVSFQGCNLDFTSFAGKKLKKTLFDNCSLKEANFSDCDLSEVIFRNSDLHLTLFSRTNLTKADFRTAYNYTLDPEENTLKNAKFSAAGLPGLLAKYNIIVE